MSNSVPRRIWHYLLLFVIIGAFIPGMFVEAITHSLDYKHFITLCCYYVLVGFLFYAALVSADEEYIR